MSRIPIILIVSFGLFLLNTPLQAITTIKNLRVEYMRNPIGIDTPHPRFSWEMESDEIGKKQSAYAITVEAGDGSTVWDSGQINSDKSVGIKYDGTPLDASTHYLWKVTVWDSNQSIHVSTESVYFETGLMTSGWSGAKWLEIDKAKDETIPVTFTLSCDVTVIDQNAGIIFGAQDINNMHMWAINTYGTGINHPILRRHIFTNGNVQSTDIPLPANFTTDQIIGIERRLKMDVINQTVHTYLDDVLIDTYFSPTLENGYIGFRTYTGDNDTHEHAYIDNIEYKYTSKDISGNLTQGIFTEDFENGSNDFDGSSTITINDNTKMDLKAEGNYDFRVLQGTSNGIPMFRTEFSLDKAIKSAKIYSSGLGVYDLFINGKRVGKQQENGNMIYDEFKPGWTDYRKTVFYSTYNVTGMLTEGQNAIGAQVSSGWFNGAIAHDEYGNPDLGFLAKLIITYADGSQDTVVTDPSRWKTSTNSAIRLADIYNGETYDARKNKNWTVVGFDDSDWKTATTNDYFKGNITAFIGQPVRVRPELSQNPKTITVYQGIKTGNSTYGEINITRTLSDSETFSLQKGETAIVDFGQNIVGWIKFKVKGANGAKIRSRFSEMLNDSGESSRGNDNAKGTLYLKNLRSAKATLTYTLNGNLSGETYNPSTTFFGFRYCEISATDDIEIESIIGEVVGNINEENSYLTTDNPSVNKLYNNVRWGQRGNFLSIPTDCPQRDERLGWMGDAQIFSRAATYNADVASFFQKWIKDIRDSQLTDGSYPSVVPDNWRVGYGRTAWAEAGIIIPWHMYLMYDDKEMLREHYSSMDKYMDWMSTQQFDGYLYNGGNTQYGDWLAYEPTSARFISVSYYAYVAKLMAKISNALSVSAGDIYEQNAEKYNTLYNAIKTEFQKRYVSTRNGLLLENSQTAYLLALSNDLLQTPETTKSALNYLVDKIQSNGNKLSTGFVGTGILNQTLSRFGASGVAYDLLLQRNDPSWLYSVDQGATTIWERWNSYTIANGFGDPGMNSFNHYSYGAVSEWMYRFMAGIETDENNPAFKHFILQPMPDIRNVLPDERINKVEATYGSYYGLITSKWERKDNDSFRYSVTVPANTSATMYIRKVKDSDRIGQNGISADKVPGVTSIVDEGNRFVLELQSGSYVFDTNLAETAISNAEMNKDYLKIYPNPISKGGNLFVETALDQVIPNTSFVLYALSGNRITDYAINQQTTSIAMNQAQGIYLLEYKSDENSIKKIKLIVK